MRIREIRIARKAACGALVDRSERRKGRARRFGLRRPIACSVLRWRLRTQQRTRSPSRSSPARCLASSLQWEHSGLTNVWKASGLTISGGPMGGSLPGPLLRFLLRVRRAFILQFIGRQHAVRGPIALLVRRRYQPARTPSSSAGCRPLPATAVSSSRWSRCSSCLGGPPRPRSRSSSETLVPAAGMRTPCERSTGSSTADPTRWSLSPATGRTIRRAHCCW